MDIVNLDHLARVATERGQTALWKEALPLIVDSCGAMAGRVLIGLSSPAWHQWGDLTEPVAEAIDSWELSLSALRDWVPFGSGSLSSAPPVSNTVIHPTLPLVHIVIHSGSSVIGGLSLAFAPEFLPAPRMVNTATLLTQAIARLAALAIERYRVQRRLTQLSLLYEVSRIITSTLEVNAVLEYTTALAVNALGAEAASLLLVDPESQELVLAASHGEAEILRRQRGVPTVGSVPDLVVRSSQPIIVNDEARSRQRHSVDGDDEGFLARNVICTPLVVRGQALGALEVLNKQGAGDFDEDDLDWLNALAAQAAIAIENARLYSSLQDERDRLIQTEAELRHRVARNLHDSATQILSSLMMNIEVTRRLAKIGASELDPEFDLLRELANQAHAEIRESLFELRPLVLESRGLVGAFQAYVSQQGRRGFAITLQAGPLPFFDDKKAESAVFMIVQEALHNVRKHARAKTTWLRVHMRDSTLVVEVEDDGQGFSTSASDASYYESGSMGLLTMKERTEWLGGTISIVSPRPQHNDGTLVTLRVPGKRMGAMEDGGRRKEEGGSEF